MGLFMVLPKPGRGEGDPPATLVPSALLDLNSRGLVRWLLYSRHRTGRYKDDAFRFKIFVKDKYSVSEIKMFLNSRLLLWHLRILGSLSLI